MQTRLLTLILLIAFASTSFAGVDIGGHVTRLWIDGGGNVWFKLDNDSADPYCAKGWYDFNLYVPAADPNYPYLYGLLMTAASKKQSIYVANISVFNGSTACDVTRTGYGLVLFPPP